MSLTSLAFPLIMDTSTYDLIKEFFVPALDRSLRYDRGVGFFSSGWLRIAASGMARFASNGGRARWITSPILSESDWEALRVGQLARDDLTLHSILARNIRDLQLSMEQDTLSALAWLVADNVVDFKIALPSEKLVHGEFHDKFGVFTDHDGMQISFAGSYNDSIQGTRNYESIRVFCSWSKAYEAIVTDDATRFERLWSGDDPNVRVYELPDASRENLIKLRAMPRPYNLPDEGSVSVMQQKLDALLISHTQSIRVPSTVYLRPYQEEAISAWFRSQSQGIWEMATGTGKTITALSAAVRLIEQEKRVLVVIVCPFVHLVEQWADEAERFGFEPIRIAGARSLWESLAANELRAFTKQRKDVIMLVTTNSTMQGKPFSDLLRSQWNNVLFVFDEAHYAGAPATLRSLPNGAPWRLGLSATPIRYYDEEGTDSVFNYFRGVVFEFGLREAIGTYLARYYYHPIPVEMTESEFEEYRRITQQLQRHIDRDTGRIHSDAGKRLAILRSRVMNNSENKLKWLRENVNEFDSMEFTIFYVGDRLFQRTCQLIGLEKRVKIHEFTHRQNRTERAKILSRFSRGDLQALIAMKCLDEGVDVPATRTAYFLASSGNPREFVQRRGRVLRLAPGKEFATIYDLISVPPYDVLDGDLSQSDWPAVRAAIRREYRRVIEFSELAENRYQALDHMFTVASKLGLTSA